LSYHQLVAEPAILKWKPEITVDLKVLVAKDGKLSLYSSDRIYSEGQYFPEDFLFMGTPTNHFNNAVDMDNIPFNSGSIVEFRWNTLSQQLVAIRNRNDKAGANRPFVAEDNWKRMTQSNLILDRTTLLGRNNSLVKKAHNRIKSTLLSNAVKGVEGLTLLDIGGGQGADINKWSGGTATSKPLFRHIFCVEPNEDNIRDFRVRLAEYPNLKNRVHLLQARGQDTKDIRSLMNEYDVDKVDVVSMMDSLTFFFNPDNSDLEALGKTVKRCLKPGGSFIFKMMDGTLVEQAFQLQRSTTLKFGEDTIVSRLGTHQVEVTILPWITQQTEWLSSVDRLTHTLNLKGVARTAITETLLTPEYGAYSALYSYGDFKLDSDITHLPQEIVQVYNASEPFEPPFHSAATALEALERIFTKSARKYIIPKYIELAISATPHERAPKGTPAFTYFECALQGLAVNKFLSGRTVTEIFTNKPTDFTALVVADMLQLDVFIVDVDDTLLATNAVVGRDQSSIVLTKTTEYVPVWTKRGVIFPSNSRQVSGYQRLEPRSVLESYYAIIADYDPKTFLRDVTGETYATLGGVYSRLLYINLGVSRAAYLNVLGIILKGNDKQSATVSDLVYYTKFYPKAKVAEALEYLNTLLTMVSVQTTD
jgi:SAM-dependent methyltransferase